MAPGSRFRNAIGWLGLVDDDRYVEVTPAEEPAVTPDVAIPADPPSARPAPGPGPVRVQTPAPAPVVVPRQPPVSQAEPANATGFAGDNSRTMLLTPGPLISPPGYDDIQPIVDRYCGGLVTIMNLRGMPVADAKRSLDFCAGVAYALQGSCKRLRSGVFLLVPVGARIDQSAIDDALAELR